MYRTYVVLVKLACGLFMLLGGIVGHAGASESDASWPQWRGPNRDGIIHAKPWPDVLDEEHFKQQWRVELGPSYSGPIVVDNRVYVTETVDRTHEAVRALDRKTGKELWKTSWEGSLSVPFFAKSNGDWIRATPAYDEGRLYVAGMRDVLVCLNAESGDEIWRKDFVAEFEARLPAFGFVSSPLIAGDAVYVQAGGGLVKLDKRSGEVAWRVLEDGGGMYGSAFSSPFLATIDGKPRLLVQTRTQLAVVDPDSGDVLASQEIPAFRGMNILTPTVYGEDVLTSSYGGRTFMFDITNRDGKWALEEKWTNKVQGYMSSPIVIEENAYFHLKNQRFTCIDLATGKSRWTSTPYGKYCSMAACGDKILALDQRGGLLLIRASPEKPELLDRRKVGDDSWAHLAVCGNDVFIRELDAIAVYQWE